MARFLWQDRKNRFRTALANGEIPVVVWVGIPWAPVMEMAGAHGADAVMIDLEHTSIGLETLELLLASAQLAGVTSMVRVPSTEPSFVARVLDARAEGIIFPDIRTVEEARTARTAMRYPPEGVRGWGGAHTRQSVWQGARVDAGKFPDPPGVYSEEYINIAHNETLSVFMIESVEGIENIDEILDEGKPDLAIFGMGDFSIEVRFDSALCQQAADKAHKAFRDRGIGTHISPAKLAEEYYPGCYTVLGMDTLLLSHAMEDAIARGKAVIEKLNGSS